MAPPPNTFSDGNICYLDSNDVVRMDGLHDTYENPTIICKRNVDTLFDFFLFDGLLVYTIEKNRVDQKYKNFTVNTKEFHFFCSKNIDWRTTDYWKSPIIS